MKGTRTASLILSMTLTLAGLTACGGGGGDSPTGTSTPVASSSSSTAAASSSSTAAAALTLTTTSAASYGALNGSVSNVRSGASYFLEFDLGKSVIIRQPLLLRTDGSFVATAPAGVADANTLFASGTIKATLLQQNSATQTEVLNSANVAVTVPSLPADNALGQFTTIFAKLQLQIIADATAGMERLSALGISSLNALDRPDANQRYYERLIAAAAAVASTGRSAVFATETPGKNATLTPEALAVLDKQCFLLINALPAAPKKPASISTSQLRVQALPAAADLTDYPTWSRQLTDGIRDSGAQISRAAGVVLGVGAIAAVGTSLAVPLAVASATAFMVSTFVPAATGLAIDGFVGAMDKGQAGFDDAAPTLSYMGKAYAEYAFDDIAGRLGAKVCGDTCELIPGAVGVGGAVTDAALSWGKRLTDAVGNGITAVKSKFADASLPPNGVTASGFTISRVGLTQDAPTNGLPTPAWLVSVYLSPDTIASTQNFTISIVNADGVRLAQNTSASARSYSVRMTLTRQQACSPSLTFVVVNDKGTASARTTASGSGFCTDSAGSPAPEEFIEWSIAGQAVARTKPGANLGCGYTSCPAGAANISLSLTGSAMGQDAAIDIRLDRLSWGLNNTFRDKPCIGSTNTDVSYGEVMVFNAAVANLNPAPLNYMLPTCAYLEKTGGTTAGTMTISFFNIPYKDVDTINGLPNILKKTQDQYVKGSFSFSVSDVTPDLALLGGFALGTKVVTGTFQFHVGECRRFLGDAVDTCWVL